MKEGRIIIGISGASGMVYAMRLMDILLTLPKEIHVIISEMGWKVLRHELKVGYAEFSELMDSMKDSKTEADIIIHSNRDLFAPVASGSFPVQSMGIIPCSMKTLSGIACGYADDLISRAADVTLKEKRPLVLLVRETPLNLIHLKNMTAAAGAGATIMPASPGFYHHPQDIGDLADFMVGRVLDQMNIEAPHIKRWGEI